MSMFLVFREGHCPVCGIMGEKDGQHHKCINCETIFSKFGIIQEPFEGKLPYEEFDDIFQDN
jgi:hypothetical protein